MLRTVHKTFRRYTVRKKQGGAQSSQGGANSAGARVRMYNEKALKLEVRELLQEWSHWIGQSECVFVHAPGNNRRTLFYDGAVISAADRAGRLRSIPFVTRRPTLAELKRTYTELTTVKMLNNPTDAHAKAGCVEQELSDVHVHSSESDFTATSSPSTLNNPSGSRLNNAETALIRSSNLRKLVKLVKKGRTVAMTNHLDRLNINPSGLLPVSVNSEYDRRGTPTILHLAAQHGQAQIVKQLLEVHYADPTLTAASFIRRTGTDAELISDDFINLDIQSKPTTAYDIAKDKETRNAFRRAMAKMPDTWDWVGLAHVPSPLTPELEAKQQRPHEEKQSTPLNDKPKKSGIQVEPSPGNPATIPISIGFAASNSQVKWEQGVVGDREKRAKAAEGRILASKQATAIDASLPISNSCLKCSVDLETLSPSEKFSHQLCGESSLLKKALQNN
ncbi:hypothetical protein BGX27_009068 [Mortierella sp. AM989]|nr:hypothetical protein BGX27_009068 [Mortierella sp. AM989]